MIKKVFLILIALIMLALPVVARWFYLNEGQYEPQKVTRPDLSEIEAPIPEMVPFVDEAEVQSPGTILVDLAHANRLDMSELGVLQARLSARGQRLEPVVIAEDLEQQLRYAKALVVVSPGMDWTPGEIEQVEVFVKKGGRLLLIADPTRYGIGFDEWDLPFVDDDVPHINDLAARFGLRFQTDYLYNTSDNAGNFRNIKLTEFDGDLTQGLDQVVFYAARSITTDGPALISAGGETRSSGSDRLEALTVASLVADGAVLALGDLTFMTEPYNAVYDNDRLVANIADLLSGAQREFDLGDFPYLFADHTDLVYAGAPVLDSDLLQVGGALQALFAGEGKELTVRDAEDGAADTLFLGLYENADEVEPYLAAAQVTLCVTPTELVVDEPQSSSPSSPAPAPVPTEALTTTSTLTPTAEGDAVPEPVAKPEITATAMVTPPAECHLEIESLGEMVVTGTVLMLLQNDRERQTLVVLADTESGLANAIERLTVGNLEGCLFRETETPASTLALCSSGEVGPGDGEGGWQEPEPDLPTPEQPAPEPVEPPDPVSEPKRSVIVVALDHGEGRYDGMTSVADYEIILADHYNVDTWSTSLDGLPGWEELVEYDLVVWSVGDYQGSLGDEESEILFDVMIESVPIILSGAFIGDAGIDALQRDIQVYDADHPITDGFDPDEVIGFVNAPSSEDYEMSLLEDMDEGGSTAVPFVRGPDSDEAGALSVLVLEDEFGELRIVFIGFPIYLLPEEAKARLVLNIADWMLKPH